MYYDIKKIDFVLKKSGSSMRSSYAGSLSNKRPQSQFEAQKMAIEWINKKYPEYEIADLKIEYR